MKTLYDQLVTHRSNLECVAVLCNTDADNIGFGIDLRRTPALPSPFTIGQASRAYLKTVCAKFERQPDPETPAETSAL